MLPVARAALSALDTLAALPPSGPLTDEQRAALAAWPGWGPLTPAFVTEPDEQWAPVADALDRLCTPEVLAVARQLLDNSFYTPTWLVEQIFDVLRGAGFTGGGALEPGCGIGRFMAGAPADMDLTWTGVERDPVAARIAARLHPEATIHAARLQKVALTGDSFDLAIGNVPFATGRVTDNVTSAASLHGYFLARACAAVRPGGFIVAITSRYTMDGDEGLDEAQKVADLRGVVRLPAGTFRADGTDAVADVLIMQRRQPNGPVAGWDDRAERAPEPPAYPRYGYTAYREPSYRRLNITETVGNRAAPAVPEQVNRYFEVHPDHVAGRMCLTGFEASPVTVLSKDPRGDVAAAFASVATGLPTYQPPTDPLAGSLDDVVLTDTEGRKEGSFHVIEGAVFRVEHGKLLPVARAGKELRALIELRDAAAALVAAESDSDIPDEQLSGLRDDARRLYQAYAGQWGPLNRGVLHEGAVDAETGLPAMSWRRPALGGFRRDPDAALVWALEVFDQESGQAGPAPILLRRVNRRPEPVTHADSASDALAVCLGESGRLDLARVAELRGLDDEEAVIAELGDLVYRDPQSWQWVTAAEYLSGNVRAKLDQARTAADGDRQFARNVAALETIVPPLLGVLDIRVSLGAPWVPAAYVADFAREVLESGSTRVDYLPAAGYWEVDPGRSTPAAALAYGTPRLDPAQILAHGLNGKAVIVYDEVWEHGRNRKVRNAEQTQAAEAKLAEMQARFSTWVWENADRAETIARIYNTRFNSHVARRFSGDALTFPGLADGVELWPWQKSIVERVASTQRVLCGHAVGSGKTLSMVASAVTLRRFGLANKPLIIVPNHLLDQISREAQQAYPLGRFLIASKDDLAGDARRLFAARCLTGEWDAVIMTHQGFTSLPVSPHLEQDWLQEQIADLTTQSMLLGRYDTRRGAKMVAAQLRKLEERLDSLLHGRTDPRTVFFDQLGIDWIAVDEAHAFKRLPITTRAQGFSLGASKRATDLLLKIEALAQRNPHRPAVAFFTGTPWTNTLAETYVWQRYLQPNRLRHAQVDHFDAWAATFVRWETRVEVAPDGSGFRLNRRPAVIQNAPELMAMLADIADLLPSSDLPLPRPNAHGQNIAVDSTDEQHEFVQALVERADALRTRAKVKVMGRNGDMVEDNMLMICGDGRKVALDPTLVGVGGDSPKLAAVAEQVARIYHSTKDRRYGDHPALGALQLVFCDLGTPQPGDTQTYGRLRAQIVAQGVPAAKVRFVHEATTDKARAALFEACRTGKVAALLGSTPKLGLGVNIQARLTAIHHVDAPWLAADIEQRDGRALRPGNLNPDVEILRYVTTGSFDAFMWSAIERKARFIAQLFRRGHLDREIEDVGDTVLTYGQVKALAAGNPLLMRQAELAADVHRLRTLRAVHRQQVGATLLRAEQQRTYAARCERDAATARTLHAEVTAPTAADYPTVEHFVNRLRQLKEGGRDASSQVTMLWRGVTVSLDGHNWGMRWEPSKTMTLSLRTRDYHSLSGGSRVLDLPPALLRRKLATAADGVARRLDEFVANLPDLAEQFDQNAEAARAAADGVSASEGMDFPGDAELAAAEAALASINGEIADQVAA